MILIQTLSQAYCPDVDWAQFSEDFAGDDKVICHMTYSTQTRKLVLSHDVGENPQCLQFSAVPKWFTCCDD